MFLNENTIYNVDSASYLDVGYGIISDDAVWPATMPLHFKKSVIVQGDDGDDQLTTLTVDPGVRMQFDSSTLMTIGGSSGLPGAIIARGTPQDQIVFTSNQASPAPGDWQGLRFDATTDDSTTILEHCIVEYASSNSYQQAIYINFSSPTISYCIIRYSLGDGIKVQSGSPIISNCTFTECGRYGIYASSGVLQIIDNTFTSNGDYDIYLSNCTGSTVTGNNLGNGIYSNKALAEISSNTIVYNTDFPPLLNPDDVGSYATNNTITNITADSYIEVITGTITRDAVWPDLMPYRITGNITVKGTDGYDNLTTLTLDAGAELRFNRYYYLKIGDYSGDPGALKALGSTESPVLMTSNYTTPMPGDWGGVRFFNTADDATSILQHCQIDYAGYSIYGGIYLYQASPTIDSTVVRESKSYGIYLSNAAPHIEACQFINSVNYDLYYTGTIGGSLLNNTINNGLYLNANGQVTIDGNAFNYSNSYPIKAYADHIGAIVSTSTFSNVDANSYIEVSGNTIALDATWTAIMPYHMTSSPRVQGTDGADGVTTLTLEPGAELRFNRYKQLSIGNTSGNPGALIAQGTAVDPIVFTSKEASPASGDWYGLRMYSTTDDASTILDHCVIEYAGSSQGACYLYSASPTIHNTTIANSKSYGIYISSSQPDIDHCQFIDNENYDLYYSGTIGGVLANSTIHSGIYLKATGELDFSSNTIVQNNSFPIKAYADHVGSLVSGSVFSSVDADSYIEVSGSTITRDAQWTAAMPYHITTSITVSGTDGADGMTTLNISPGAQLRFDRYRQITIGRYSGDQGALSAVGTWDRPIFFTANQSSPVAGDWNGIVFENTASDQISELAHCVVEYGGSNFGNIYCNSAAPQIHDSTIRHSSSYGIMTSSAEPIITANAIVDNAQDGVHNATAAQTVLAENNWWGHASGPYHESANPTGQGGTVSDNVDFNPWSTTAEDKDDDGIDDNWEFAHFGDLSVADATTDSDNDGVLDIDEYLAGLNPLNPDSDGDGMPDGWELAYGLNPSLNDALNDADNDGVSNLAEYLAGTSPIDDSDAPVVTVEDFESGDLDLFYWVTSPPENWGVTSSRAFSGDFAAESYPIGDNQITVLETAVNCEGGRMGFMFSISSQPDYDKLEFYIDGQMEGEWSGEQPYTSVHFDVTAGRHDFKWAYIKDAAGAENQDTAWLDYIIFPGMPDSDSDAILDGWEFKYFDTLNHDMSNDSDNDGVTDGDEYIQGTDPLVPN